MNKTIKILEIIWLVMACIGIAMCIYSLVIKDYRGAVYFFAFFLIGGFMFAVRRHQRIKYEEEKKRKNQN